MAPIIYFRAAASGLKPRTAGRGHGIDPLGGELTSSGPGNPFAPVSHTVLRAVELEPGAALPVDRLGTPAVSQLIDQVHCATRSRTKVRSTALGVIRELEEGVHSSQVEDPLNLLGSPDEFHRPIRLRRQRTCLNQ